MKTGAPSGQGAPRLCREGPIASARASSRGFTLLEMCTVLLIIMILMASIMPSIQSAFVEQAVRNDSRELSLMVRTAMLQCNEQHRPYVIDLTAHEVSLHPVGQKPPEGDSSTTDNHDDDSSSQTVEDVEATRQFDSANKLMVPDPKKADAWIAMPPTSWTFRPGELCPASNVRLVRGKSWLELNFNGLTGNVENESSYFP